MSAERIETLHIAGGLPVKFSDGEAAYTESQFVKDLGVEHVIYDSEGIPENLDQERALLEFSPELS